jgi:hypothetical protein
MGRKGQAGWRRDYWLKAKEKWISWMEMKGLALNGDEGIEDESIG